MSYMNLGVGYFSKNDFSQALEFYQKAYDIAVNLENKEFENWLINDMNFDKELKNNDGETAYA